MNASWSCLSRRYLVTIADYFDFEVLCLSFKAVFVADDLHFFLISGTVFKFKNSLSRKIASKYCRQSVLIARKFPGSFIRFLNLDLTKIFVKIQAQILHLKSRAQNEKQ